MKHYVFSKWKKEKGKRKKCWRVIVSHFSFLIFYFLFVSCVQHDEVEFRGTIIDYRECSSLYLDQNPGYVVQLEYPENLGGSYNNPDRNITGGNAVVLYEPDRHIMVGDVVHGTFYLDDKYSRINCNIHYGDTLPEGVFLKVRSDNKK